PFQNPRQVAIPATPGAAADRGRIFPLGAASLPVRPRLLSWVVRPRRRDSNGPAGLVTTPDSGQRPRTGGATSRHARPRALRPDPAGHGKPGVRVPPGRGPLMASRPRQELWGVQRGPARAEVRDARA